MAKTASWHAAGERRVVETKPPVPRAILVGVQLPGIDDLAHAASMEELGRLVNTLGYEVVGTVSQKRDEIDGNGCGQGAA
jgi:GTPase